MANDSTDSTDSSASSSSPRKSAGLDPSVKDTLRFLTDQLMLQQFILRAQTRKHAAIRKQIVIDEAATRSRISELKTRFNRELDANPALRQSLEDDDSEG